MISTQIYLTHGLDQNKVIVELGIMAMKGVPHTL